MLQGEKISIPVRNVNEEFKPSLDKNNNERTHRHSNGNEYPIYEYGEYSTKHPKAESQKKREEIKVVYDRFDRLPEGIHLSDGDDVHIDLARMENEKRRNILLRDLQKSDKFMPEGVKSAIRRCFFDDNGSKYIAEEKQNNPDFAEYIEFINQEANDYSDSVFDTIKAQKQRWHDEMTGLDTRNAFLEVARNKLWEYKESGKNSVLMFVDMDDFKSINDKYGHDVGDQAIVAVANILKSQIGDNYAVYRYGGDEFVFVMYDADIATAVSKAEDIIESIKSENEKTIHRKLSVSVGISSTENIPGWLDADKKVFLNEKIKDLVKSADNALYLSKGDGKGRYSVAFSEQ